MAHFLSSAKVSPFLKIHSGGIALLMVYICTFTVSSNFIPHKVHDHHDHAGAKEHDPCHISIFHPGAEGGCEHKFHFTKNCPDCQESDVTLIRKVVASCILWIDIPMMESAVHDCICESTFFYSGLLHHDRGPPALTSDPDFLYS